jgi:hypothetical protein
MNTASTPFIPLSRCSRPDSGSRVYMAVPLYGLLTNLLDSKSMKLSVYRESVQTVDFLGSRNGGVRSL